MLLLLIIFSAISLVLFLSGIALAVIRITYFKIIVILLGIGLLGLCISTLMWAIRPFCLTYKPKYLIIKAQNRRLNRRKPEVESLNPHTTEEIMKSIRGIPNLIQVIFYFPQPLFLINI